MKGTRKKTSLQLWIALALGLGLRLLFITNAARIAGDTLLYGDIAKNWMQFGVYGFAHTATGGTIPTLIRLPGYPIFLALCFSVFGPDHYTQVMLVQCLVDLGTCLLIAGLAHRLFGHNGGMLALWLSALCPFMANYVAAPLTETLTLFCIALSFYSLERWHAAGKRFNRWLWVIAAALSYAVLLRPEQGLLAVAVLPMMLIGSGGGKQVVLPVVTAAICVLLPLVPWTLRNWHTFHVFEPLAPRYATDPGEAVPRGFQRWFKTWAIDFASTENVYWNWDSDPIDISSVPSRAFDTQGQYDRTAELLAIYGKDNNATPELDQGFEALAKERIEDSPLRYYVALPVARLFNMMLRPRTEMMEVGLEWWQWKKHPMKTAFATGYALLNFGYFLLGCLGLWRWRQVGTVGTFYMAGAMTLYLILRCTTLLTLDNSEPRYTLEFFPLLIVWSAALFLSSSTLKSARNRQNIADKRDLR